jgi:hypothetical protein
LLSRLAREFIERPATVSHRCIRALIPSRVVFRVSVQDKRASGRNEAVVSHQHSYLFDGHACARAVEGRCSSSVFSISRATLVRCAISYASRTIYRCPISPP